MITAILQHTPVWVWGLLAALIALGLSQARDREVSRARVTLLPIVMVALSAFGVLSVFGPALDAIAAWVVGMAASLTAGPRLVAARGARWMPSAQTLHVPGSWLPLVLILALFCIKFAVGVSTAQDAALVHQPVFATLVSLAYGVFSGLFAARARSVLHAAGPALAGQAA